MQLIQGKAMKTTALCLIFFVSTSSLVAEDGSRLETSCRELVTQIRAGLSEGEEAERHLESADRAYRDCRGMKLPLEIRVKALFKYGLASSARAREQAALEALREAIGLLDRAPGDHAELFIEILDSTVFLENRLHMQTDANVHSKRALDIRAKRYGPRSAEVAVGLVNLAIVHAAYNEYGKAEALLRDAIRMAEKACGPQCDALVTAYSGMEVIHEQQGNSAEARKYTELALEAVPPRRRKD